MDSQEIADKLKLTAKLMDLHNENSFKVKALTNAAFRLSKSGIDLETLSEKEIYDLEGVGKGIAGMIMEFRENGTSTELDALLAKTPAGIIEMLGIKGIGPKKVGALWRELGIENMGELLYACTENRLVGLKGFGEKTQAEVKKNIEFKMMNAGRFHYAVVEPMIPSLIKKIQSESEGAPVEVVGEFRRKMEIINSLEFLICSNKPFAAKWTESGLKVSYRSVEPKHFWKEVVRKSSSEDFYKALPEVRDASSEEQVFKNLGYAYPEPEYRESVLAVDQAKTHSLPQLVTWNDLKGCLHNHSTWSDGLHSIKEMSMACQELGLSYFGICDHSKTAAYAGGLSIEKVAQQQQEIDQLNKTLKNFAILKGIESDILGDGSLDYPEEVLDSFDFVVASVHQNLKMEEKKATERLIKAVENPFTTILGHPTGRLLLSRPGYPIDHKKVIDACAANHVAIELNAHPWRLDLDWRWIPYCMEKNVMISINPDAHETGGILDMHYGINMARKGGLTAVSCLNALALPDLLKWFSKKK